jgi:ABC-type transport system involved in multi-copper enzyme maturation permease subunit
MTYLVWRQYRLQWAIGLALLAAFAAVELINGLHMAHTWHSLLTTCPANSANGSCLQQTITDNLGENMRLIAEIVPGLLGIFWGAPLVAHELETGTATFAWTQGVPRSRWLWTKVGLLLLAAALWGAAVAALVTWWSGPVNAQQGSAFAVNNFDTQGIVPIGYAVFAMALGIAAGAVFRKTLPAIAVTIAGFIAVRLVIAEVLRQHLMPPVTATFSMLSNGPSSPGWWVISQGMVGPNGHPLVGSGPNTGTFNGTPISAFPAACQQILNGTGNTMNALNACLAKAGIQQTISYQPGYRFWPIQGIETGLYVLLATALLAVAWYSLRRRDA